ncbi:hypothetical protein BD324DRAFT_634091 [Kockovaella imperatae]|uniref:Uncharacterized protein n=1 Tax=Kockovaella imperatae TaxID=4999 RepID=A0A1Y1UAV7_9TREE|nr:hypothetical protein BD324DRAFT_634091 [Kockovaella imperatae]ORX35163.1 hypothetical protein BD324DRAFT_634091 [Kockovaella imperatae]
MMKIFPDFSEGVLEASTSFRNLLSGVETAQFKVLLFGSLKAIDDEASKLTTEYEEGLKANGYDQGNLDALSSAFLYSLNQQDSVKGLIQEANTYQEYVPNILGPLAIDTRLAESAVFACDDATELWDGYDDLKLNEEEESELLRLQDQRVLWEKLPDDATKASQLSAFLSETEVTRFGKLQARKNLATRWKEAEGLDTGTA